jgi:hypothetical protein
MATPVCTPPLPPPPAFQPPNYALHYSLLTSLFLSAAVGMIRA